MKKTKNHNQADTEQCPESAANVDWDALFREFVESPFFVARSFLRLRLGTKIAISGWVRRRTAGWPAEKKALIKELEKRALERVQNYKEDNLVSAKKLYIQEMMDRIVLKGYTLSHKEMASNIRAIKTELGEPSIITKQNIVEEPLDDEEAFNRLMRHHEKHTPKTTGRADSAGPKRRRRADAQAMAGKPA